MSFSLELSEFTKMTDHKMLLVTKKVALQLFTDVIKDTPVDQGRLKGAWMPSVNKFDTSVWLTPDKSRKGQRSADSKAKIAGEFNTVKLGDTLTLSNNMDYAEVVEYGLYVPVNSEKVIGGFSAKAPAGMVGINLLRWQKKVDDIAKALNG